MTVNSESEIYAIFVNEKHKRNGIGRKLVNHCKDLYSKLKLKVYVKNVNAVVFFTDMGFKNQSNSVNEDTGELEYIMEWKD